MMKRITTAFLLLFSGSLMAQQVNEVAPMHKPVGTSLSLYAGSNLKGPGVTPSPTALWDIQSFYALDTICSTAGGFAGLCWTGTEWWVSQWNKDSLYTLDINGNLLSAFKVTGVGAASSGVRSMTFDGTTLYAADNTSTIKKINPATKTLIGTINISSAGFNARSITYSQAINGGAGGFYMSNFGTDIVEISLTGTVLSAIPLATHTLSAIYGLAYDNLSPGGPYLWGFDQTSSAQDANLVRLSLPSGAPTAILHNVNADIGVQTNVGIAGGVTVTDSYVPGHFTIAGVSQGTLDIFFAYELDSSSAVNNDIALSFVDFTPMNTIIPDEHILPVSFPVEVENVGGSTLTTVTATVTAAQNGSNIATFTGSTSNVAPSATASIITTGTLTPSGQGTYDISAILSLTGQTDSDPTNDSTSFSITVSDTTFAIDNGQITGSLGIGNGSGGTLGQLFSLNVNDVITTVTIALNGPTSGDSTRVVVYDFNGTPNLMLGASDYYVFTDADTNGIVMDMVVKNMAGNPLALTAGTYFFGVEEIGANITLATSEFNWRPAITWVTFTNQPWAPNEDFGFNRVYVLRPNTGNSITSILEVPSVKNIEVYPNPATSEVYFRLEKGIVSFDIMDVRGAVVRHAQFEMPAKDGQVTLAGLPAGVYQVRARDLNGMSYVSRLVKQ